MFVLMCGGDCDTNAAIVGGVLGAVYGYDAIPKWMRNPVLKHDPEHNNGIKRPTTYKISQALAKCL